MKGSDTVYQIAVPVPLRQHFDYLGPDSLLPGTRALVPFGSKKLVGVILSNKPASTTRELKSIIEVLDAEPVLDHPMLDLLLWAADYHHHPVGEVLAAGIPTSLRRGNPPNPPATGKMVYRAADIPTEEVNRILGARSPSQERLYRALSLEHWRYWDDLRRETGCRMQILEVLKKKGLVETRKESPSLMPLPDRNAIRLNSEQQQAANRILDSLDDWQTFLLQGVTGSGKTEVYLEVARQAIGRGTQILFLVPEISLTPQLIARVREYLGDSVRCLHSGISSKDRYETWRLARTGRISVVLGTRSAVFTPLKNPGLIVVDEEHDGSYKQDDGFRYNARNLAIKRASLSHIPVVLGSATPSLESLHNVRRGRYRILQLKQRYGSASLPVVRIIDSSRFTPRDGLSTPLLQAIRERLDQGEQSILYVNRRGYATVVRCYECGWEADCHHCSARLIYHHMSGLYRCHHCGFSAHAHPDCPECGEVLFLGGVGTQKLEQVLYGIFPQARICRMDRDEIRTPGRLHDLLEQIRVGEVDIVVGTQLITKGHDFSRVSLVGVVNADQGLYNIDFRATEFLFQELLQVAGRSGRADTEGEVLIQTANPTHPCIQKLVAHDYMGFVDFEWAERDRAGYPPFVHLSLFRTESKNGQQALRVLEEVHSRGLGILRETGIEDVEILPPAPSPLEKRADHYRMQMIVRSRKRTSLHEVLNRLCKRLDGSRLPPSVRWSLDVDPMMML